MKPATIAPPMLAEAVIASPEFCDSKQVKLLFGLSRTHAYLLAQEGKIRSVSLRRRGATRGRRLFDCASIRAFLNKNAEGGEDRRHEARSPDCPSQALIQAFASPQRYHLSRLMQLSSSVCSSCAIIGRLPPVVERRCAAWQPARGRRGGPLPRLAVRGWLENTRRL